MAQRADFQNIAFHMRPWKEVKQRGTQGETFLVMCTVKMFVAVFVYWQKFAVKSSCWSLLEAVRIWWLIPLSEFNFFQKAFFFFFYKRQKKYNICNEKLLWDIMEHWVHSAIQTRKRDLRVWLCASKSFFNAQVYIFILINVLISVLFTIYKKILGNGKKKTISF